MKKVRISLALCLFFTGCGGGSSESSPSSTTDQDWVSLEVSSGQLTITATPTVFELGENAFDLVLSDGTDSSTYELTINVQDNPTSYSYIDIEQDTLRGN